MLYNLVNYLEEIGFGNKVHKASNAELIRDNGLLGIEYFGISLIPEGGYVGEYFKSNISFKSLFTLKASVLDFHVGSFDEGFNPLDKNAEWISEYLGLDKALKKESE